MTESLIECVPNFSEGRDSARIDTICSAIAATPGVLVLNRTSDWDHHRSVITFAGRREPVVEAAVRAAREAARLIDLRQHRGVHPRVGALDVLPFVPLGSATLEDCATLAHAAGERISAELGIPVYFYGAAARVPERAALENVRRGQFEVLREEALQNPERAPDLGGPALHPSAGAVIVGARKILIAFNINLRTTDLSIARRIARSIRASSGGLPAVKALGVPLPSRSLVQVSMNLTDFTMTPLHVVYEAVEQLAAAERVEIAESELIGLLPRAALDAAFSHYLKLPGFGASCVIEDQIRPLQFATVTPGGIFLPGERIC
ncbi:MAG TPA: glutamate formimidoyltransferase [Bryobacteraceae bacterium]|nr:glutamate formimidoyltransferase [Bryobacteraceae bacterium]